MNRAYVNVPQGIGDIFWIHRKLMPHFDEINYNIYVVDDTEVQNRAAPFLKHWPKVNRIQSLKTNHEFLGRFVQRVMRFDNVLKDYEGGDVKFDFIMNRWLDDGNRLEDLDSWEVAWEFDLPTQKVKLPDKYITLYVSGDSRHGHLHNWSTANWIKFVDLLYKKHGCYDIPLVIIGANYDRDVLKQINTGCIRRGIQSQLMINYPHPVVNYILGHTAYFIGYQSGVNIIADHLDVPQLIIYFPYLPRMKSSWVKPYNMDLFTYRYFYETPMSIMADLDVTNYLNADGKSMHELRRFMKKFETRLWTGFNSHYGVHTYYRDYVLMGERYQPKSILEFGVRYGYSGVALAKGATMYDDDGVVDYVGVDNEFFEQSNEKAHRVFNAFPYINATTHSHDLMDGLDFLEGRKFDMVHIDAQHDEEGVFNEMALAIEHLNPGGVIVVDDCRFPHVREPVEKYAKEHNLRLVATYPNEQTQFVYKINA